jgi:hypothetical protein
MAPGIQRNVAFAIPAHLRNPGSFPESQCISGIPVHLPNPSAFADLEESLPRTAYFDGQHDAPG